MSEAKSIEDMKAELEAAGYKWHHTIYSDEQSWIVSPDGWEFYDYELELSENELIQKAYAHYQREKRYAELEAGMEGLQARLAKVERELESLRGDGK